MIFSARSLASSSAIDPEVLEEAVVAPYLDRDPREPSSVAILRRPAETPRNPS